MKKLLAVTMILCLLIPCAIAEDDSFLKDYNVFAAHVYGIAPLTQVFYGKGSAGYTAESIEILSENDGASVSVMGEEKDALSVISSACCCLRCIDNIGSMIDQYGRIMHAYFLAKSAGDGKEYRATTKNGVLIYCKFSYGIITIKLVK